MADSSDPFLQVQADVLSTLPQTRTLHSSYLRILSLTPSSSLKSSPELLSARTDLSTALTDLQTDIEDLTASVRAASVDPFRYGLDIPEVSRRERVVNEIEAEVREMKHDLDNPSASTGMNGGAGKLSKQNNYNANGELPDPSAFAVSGEDDEDDRGGDRDGDYDAYESERQVEMLAEQDQQLDGVWRTVGNLRAQADDMGRELEEQGGLLGEVDSVADRVGGKLRGGVRRVQDVVRRNEEKASGYCIGLLIFVLVVLLILVIAL